MAEPPESLVAAILQQKPGRCISRLLRAGAADAISRRDQSGYCPAHHAVMAGSAEALQALLDHAARHTRPARTADGTPSKAPGSPWSLVTCAGPGPSFSSPLHLAAERNDALLRLILEHSSLGTGGASFFGFTLASRPHPDLLQLRDGRGWTPLVYAARANTPCLRLMLQYLAEAEEAENGSSGCTPSRNSSSSSNSSGAFMAGRSVNVPDADGLTPLHHAALLGKADNCRLLLKAGCNQAAACGPPERALPLHFAAAGNHVTALETLFRYAVAAQPGGFRVAQQVLLRPDGSGMPALHTAVLHGAVDGARRLLQLVFPFDTRGPAGRTALHLAALRGSTVMVSMLLRHSTPAQRELRDDEGLTAAHVAAAAGQLEALRTLVAEGAVAVDVRATAGPAVAGMYEGSTPLHCAVRRGVVSAVEVLVRELGADPHARDARGRAPYDLAVALAAAGASRRGSAHMSNHNSRGGRTRGGGAEAEPGMLALEEVPLELAYSEDGASGSSHSGDHAVAAGGVAPLSNETQRKSMLMGTADVALGLGLSSADEIDGGRLPAEKALAVIQTFLRLLHEPLLLRGSGDSASSLQGGGAGSMSMSGGAALSGGGFKELASPMPSTVAAPLPPVAEAVAAVPLATDAVQAAAHTAAAAAAAGAAAAQAEAAAMAVALAGDGVVMIAPVPVEWGTRTAEGQRAAAPGAQGPAVVVAAAEAAAEAAKLGGAAKGPAAPSSDLLHVLSSTTIPATASAAAAPAAGVAKPPASQPAAAEHTAAATSSEAAAGSAPLPPGLPNGRGTPVKSDAGALAAVSELSTKPSPRGGSVGGTASQDPSVHRTGAASSVSVATLGRNSATAVGAAPVSGASDGAPSLALAFLATQLAAPGPAPAPAAPPPPAPAASATRPSPFGPAKPKGARPSPFQPKASPFTPKQGTTPPRQTSRDVSANGKDTSAHGSRMSSPAKDGTLAGAVAAAAGPPAPAAAAPGPADGTTVEAVAAVVAAAGGDAASGLLANLPGVAAAEPAQQQTPSSLVKLAPAALPSPATAPSPAALPSPSEAAVLPSTSGSLPPSASCAAPGHAGPVCVISPINNPVGYSALNRAILTKRHALVDALLATLPSTGLSFGGSAAPEVVVLAPPAPSRRPMAALYGGLPHSAPPASGVMPAALAASRVTTGGMTAAGGREVSMDLAHRLPSGASVTHVHGPHGPVAHASMMHSRTLDSAKSQSTASIAATGAGVGSGSGADGSGAQQQHGRVSHSGIGQVPSGGLHRHHTPSPLSLPPNAHGQLVHATTQPHLNAGQNGSHQHPAPVHHVILGDLGARYPPSPSTVSNIGSGAATAAPHGHGHGHGQAAPGSGALTSRQTSSPFATIAGQPSGLSSSIPTGMLTSLPAAVLAPPPPLLPLCVPGPTGPVLSSHLPPPSCHSALVPGLLNWDEPHDTFRALPASQAGQRVWLHWPGEPDPATGWLLAELEIVDAGAPNGHVWLGLGRAPESLRRLRSGLSSAGGSLAPAGPSFTSAAPPASVLSPAASGAPSLAPALLRAATVNTTVTKGVPPLPLPANAAAASAAACPSTVAAAAAAPPCPVMDNPLTHVVCVRDGLAFRGGVQTASMLGVGGAAGAARMEARSGDTVSLFWNRAGRAAVFCLNGRYCGRIAGLPPAEELVPVLGLKCGGFTFRWRVGGSYSAGIAAGAPNDATDVNAAGGSPASPTATAAAARAAAAVAAGGAEAAGQNSADVDSMLVREQMMHEDPEAPWQCKAPSMTSLHFAAWSGNRRVLPQLIRAKGFHPDEPDADGWTALHFAALAGQVSIVAQLLLFGARPDACSKYGYTPVWLAAKYGRSADHVEIVRRLAEAGAGLTGRDGRGRTLLMLAAEAGNLGMVQLLLDRGLDPCATDCQDREAQQYAGQHGAIFRLLRGAVASRRGASAGARKAAKKRLAAASASKSGAAALDIASAPLLPLMAVAQPVVNDDEDEDEDEDHGELLTEEEDDEGHGGVGGGHGRRADRRHLTQLAARWRVGAGELVRGRLIEQGAFGRVFEGTWCGTRVAIKQVIPLDRRSAGGVIGDAGAAAGGDITAAPGHAAALAGLDQEVAILAALPPHERVARMLGSVTLPDEGLCLVMAYYPHTLQGVMQSERLRRSWLTPARRAAIARQLAEGLAFLHGLPALRVIHRDLKPNNVLLEAPPSLDVKICDFGLARLLAGADVQSSSAAGHAFWMAPELLRGLPYDEKVDVYSYGVILYQLAFWVDDQLYGGLNKAQVDFQVVHGLLRLQDRITASVAAAAAAAGSTAAGAAAAPGGAPSGADGTGGGASPGAAAGPAVGTPGPAAGAAAGATGAGGSAAAPAAPVVGMDPALVALVRQCVDENPKARPTMEEVVRRLAAVREMPQPQAVAMVAHRQQQQQQVGAVAGDGNEAPQPAPADGGALVGSPIRPAGLLGA
ncbi:hypothetical protein HYH02_000908 [Chlamydomonas schloesseri]|uniref:Protein kinase domain-containing protein n=1 Tax=Chlamydomonas schloesseri TaxID=2026947 RepID=A0A835WXR4_9CHLO|nr:hypothetical protein HYH02_000908 [Chlamydomonas schloesseri]|eukprot:KAG2455088.1 hypothetical protein HYH02_000908 [Chlamydomonas schloesseri]